MAEPRIGIVGWALTPYGPESPTSSEELGYAVAREARLCSGIPREAITSVHNSTMDLFDGITISNGILQPAAGGWNRDCTRIQNGGVFAILSAFASLKSGASQVAVVSSVDAVDSDLVAISNFSVSAAFDQPLGLNYISSYALFSSAYIAARKLDFGIGARIAARNYSDGSRNPHAHVRDGHSAEDVSRSAIAASPLRELELALHTSHGGAALILATGEVARKHGSTAVWFTGFGMSSFPGEFEELPLMAAPRKAARAAFAMSGVKDPCHEIASAEINAPFAWFEHAAYSSFGFCEEGGEERVLRGEGPRVNLSGGTLCTNARNSGGLVRTVKAIEQLGDGGAGAPARALVHDSDMSLGVAGSSHAVMILEKERGR